MYTADELKNLIHHSTQAANSFSFSTDVPNSPNALALTKWYKNDILTATEQITQLENELHIHSSCTSGCSACCQQLIAISKPETIMLKYAIEQMDTETVKKIKYTITKQCDFLSQNGFSISSIGTSRLAQKTEEKMKETYFSLHLPCPFLDENNACMVYQIRPTVCWAYRNYGDCALCQNSHDVPTAILYEDWEQIVLTRLFQAKKPTGGLTILQFALNSSL